MSSHKPFTLLLSGPGDSGKTWLAHEIRSRLVQRGFGVKIRRVDETFVWPNRDDVLLRDNLISVILEDNSQTTLLQTAPDYLESLISVSVRRPSLLGETGATENSDTQAFDFTFLTGVDSVSDSVSRLLGLLEEKGLLARDESETPRDEQLLIERLADLGYL
jgi:hypothetical protein